MNALVWLGPREMELREVEAPAIPADHVSVKVQAVGICGSELSGYLGTNSLRVPPLVMGHEFSGVVEKLGAAVDDVAVGDRVVVNPLLTCGECEYCLAGRENLCSRRALLGAHLPGAFADSVAVPARACLRVPAGTDLLSASLAEPLACAVRAVSLAASGDGRARSLRVIGAGPIGLLCALVARQSGFEEVSVHDPNESRARLATSWGLAGTTEPAPSSTGNGAGGADAAIDAVGLEVTRRSAIAAVRRGGTAVFVGLHSPHAAFDGNDLVRDEKVVRGCFAYTNDDFTRAVSLLGQGVVPAPREWVTIRPLADGRACFEELTGPDPASVKIVLRPSGADWSENE